jgi:hypothetical protein
MSLPDPQSVTIGGVANSLPRVSSSVNAGEFRSNDDSVKESVSHTYGNRTRRMFRIDHNKIVPDPIVSSQNNRVSMSFYIVADVPKTGYTVAQQKEVIDGFLAQLNASSGALITKFLGGEN